MFVEVWGKDILVLFNKYYMILSICYTIFDPAKFVNSLKAQTYFKAT
jgi:hypothetical protein